MSKDFWETKKILFTLAADLAIFIDVYKRSNSPESDRDVNDLMYVRENLGEIMDQLTDD